jgi:glycosyltransferase involved in cell wall biosynthesis
MSSAGQPRVTVITPAYNVGRYIGQAMDSVLAQSFPDFEYLVVDDGSTDNTADEVGRRASADPRVRPVSTDHAGACHARNVAIKQASGEFIAFLDGDDRWHPRFLHEQLALIESAGPDVAAVFARSRVMSESGRVYLLRWQRAKRYDFDDMLINSCPPRSGSSLLIKKEAFDAAGLFDEDLESAQDLDMWLRIQHGSGMPYFLGSRKYLLDIRVRAGAISRDHRKRFIALDKVIADHAPKLRRRPIGMAYVRAAVFAYRAGEDEFAARWSVAASKAGLRRLLADQHGRKVLGWSILPHRGRAMLRQASGLLRSAIGVIAGAGASIPR